MSGADIAAEIVELTRPPNADEQAGFDRAGVGSNEIWSEPNGPISVGTIHPDGGTFTFAEEGQQAFLFPVRDEFDDAVIDAIAWRAVNPARWWTRCGAADWLGAACVRMSWVLDKPMPIWRTPLAWLAHRGHGGVALFWPTCRFDLIDLAIIAEDPQHARELEQRLWLPRPPRPRVFLRRQEAA